MNGKKNPNHQPEAVEVPVGLFTRQPYGQIWRLSTQMLCFVTYIYIYIVLGCASQALQAVHKFHGCNGGSSTTSYWGIWIFLSWDADPVDGRNMEFSS